MKKWMQLLVWEGRLLARGSQLWLVCGSLLGASLLAVWSGANKLKQHRAEVASLPDHYAYQMEAIGSKFSPEGEAGYVAYYAFMPTSRPLEPLAALSMGVRDLTPSVVWVRLLGIEGQLYDADLGNPGLQALGNFDLAFVFAALAPLALLALSHDALSRERDLGRLPLLVAQSGSIGGLLALKLGWRFVAVAGTCVVAFAVASWWLGVGWNGEAARWMGVAVGNLVCWTAIAAVVAVTCRSVASSLASSIAVWVAAVALLPALLNLAVATAYPVEEGLDLTMKQRQASHGAWDRPRSETMDTFYASNPDWSGAPPVEGRFAWRWYYAMHEVADEAVSKEAGAYRENLLARQRWQARLAWLAPSAYAQLAMDNRADSDLDGHIAYLDRVREYHQQLRDYFYPLCFEERMIGPAEYAEFPSYVSEPIRSSATVSIFPLLGLSGLLFGVSRWSYRRTNQF